MKMHDQVPTCNAFDFFFSSPLTKGKPIVESLKLGKHVLPRDVPPERPMFYSPDTGNGISFEALRNTALRVAQKLSELQLGPAPASVPGLAGDVGTGQHTILLHAPNSIAFPIIVFAGLAGKYVSVYVTPRQFVSHFRADPHNGQPCTYTNRTGARHPRIPSIHSLLI